MAAVSPLSGYRGSPIEVRPGILGPVVSTSPGNLSRPSSGQQSPDRPRVLYLGGLGRSGTTVLERVLGELPGTCSVGELVHLWRRGVLDDETCGCGEPFSRCPFWSEVLRDAFGRITEYDATVYDQEFKLARGRRPRLGSMQ